MSKPKNLLGLYNKRVKKLVTVDCKSGEGLAVVPVAKLAEWNFKLVVYYVKLCELRSRPVVLSEIDDNALRII